MRGLLLGRHKVRAILSGWLIVLILLMNIGSQTELMTQSFLEPGEFSAEKEYVPSWGEEWMMPWVYRQRHSILYAMVEDPLVDYQVHITAHFGSGSPSVSEHVYLFSHSKADFSDVRFTDDDGVTLLDFWTESVVPGESATFWVEVKDDLSMGTQQIFIYYGNEDAESVSNGDDTFIFFDDFENDNLDKWDSTGSWISQSSTVLQGTYAAYSPVGGGTLKHIEDIDYNVMLHFWARSNGYRKNYMLRIDTDVGTGYDAIPLYSRVKWYSGTNYYNWPNTPTWYVDTWYEFEFGLDLSRDKTKGWKDGSFMGEISLPSKGGNPTTIESFLHAAHASYSNNDLFLDEYYIRQWVENEPPHGGWHGEEVIPFPDEPQIINIDEVFDGRYITLSWDVDWGDADPVDEHLVECWWSDDFTAVYNEESTVRVLEDMSSTKTHYSVLISTDFWIDYYYYKIAAYAERAPGFDASTAYGPQSPELTIRPTDDSFTNKAQWTKNYDSDPIFYDRLQVLRETGLYAKHTWLKFEVDTSRTVLSARLNLKIRSVGSYGHGIVEARTASTNWYEEMITYELAPPHDGALLDNDTEGNVGDWDSWDVTDLLDGSPIVSIVLVGTGDEYTEVGYYSREYSTEICRPYLEIQYSGAPEVPSGPIHVLDHFMDDSMDPNWVIDSIGSPSWSWDVTHEFYIPAPAEKEGGTFLLFEDLSGGSHTDQKGYDFTIDDLGLDGGFDINIEMGWDVSINAPNLEIGVELLDVDGFVVSYLQFEYGALDPYESSCRIEGYIRRPGGSSTNTFVPWSYPPEVVTSPHDTLLRLHRNPFTNNITLMFFEAYDGRAVRDYYNEYLNDMAPHVVLNKESDGSEIDAIRLFIRVWDDEGDSHAQFRGWFDSVKSNKMLAMAQPSDGVAPFDSPILESTFETQPLQKWKDEDGGSPSGNRDSVHTQGSYSFWGIGDPDWMMYQTLEGGRPDFRMDSILGQRVSFSYYASPDTSDVRMRAMIRYWTPGNDEPTAVVGPWKTLDSDTQSSIFTGISVATRYPLPEVIDRIDILMYGMSLSGELFTVFVDAASLRIIEDDLVSSSQNWGYLGQEGDRGQVITTLKVLEAGTNIDSKYQFYLSPSVEAIANDGYFINSIAIMYEIEPSWFSGESEANRIQPPEEDVATVHWNKENLGPDDGGVTGWNRMAYFMNHPFIRQYISSGTSLVIGVLIAGPVGIAVSIGAGIFLNQVVYPLLQPKIIDSHPEALPGDREQVEVDYPWGETHATHASLNLILGWNVLWTDDIPFACLRIRYIVEWGIMGQPYAGFSFVTHHSSLLVFDTTST